MAETAATWTKWRKTGEWAIRVCGSVDPGDVVTVARKSGESAPHRVGKILWRGADAIIALSDGEVGGATIARSAHPRPAGRRRSGRCRAHGCREQAVDRGYCARCAFDEYDD